MFVKSQKSKNPSATDLQDFGLFKKPKAPSGSAGPKKEEKINSGDDVIDVEVIEKRQESSFSAKSSVQEDTPSVEDDAQVVDTSSEEPSNVQEAPESTPEDKPSSPFGKAQKPGVKPSIHIKRPSEMKGGTTAGPKPLKEVTSKKEGFLSKLFSKNKKVKGPGDPVTTPSATAAFGSKKQDSTNAAPSASKKTSADASGGKPFNTLTVLLIGACAGAVFFSTNLANKNAELQRKYDTAETELNTNKSTLNNAYGQVAKYIDDGASLDIVGVVTKIKLLEIPDSDLMVEANKDNSLFGVSYHLKESAEKYDAAKFKESEFPAFSTGEFKSCASNNGIVKQGERDVFVIKIKC